MIDSICKMPFFKRTGDRCFPFLNQWCPVLFLLGLFLATPGCNEGSAPTRFFKSIKSLETVHIYVGGEKVEFLENPEVQKILAEKFGLKVDAVKAGSVEMVRELDLSGKDALWPSNDIAVELFRMRGGKAQSVDIVFNSPIVIYTGWNIAHALIKQGIVEKRDESYYVVKFPVLLQLILDEKTWQDIGLPFYGSVSVRCTDPVRSNSGNMFAGLVVNMLNDGKVVDEHSAAVLLPQLKHFFQRLGMMEHSSGDIFRKFIATGIHNSMVVGYENQLAEFILANPRNRGAILSSVCVLYPLPTVWSSHPVIALTDNGQRLIQALSDEDIQNLAWRSHGFRSGLMGVTQNPDELNIPGLPEQISSVIPLPTARAMDLIVEELSRH